MKRYKKCGQKNGRRNKSEIVGEKGDEEDSPYTVAKSQELGRYLVARRNLSAGETIVAEEPLIVGPCQESSPVCLGCYVDIDLDDPLSYHRCDKCSWPLCSKRCPGVGQRLGHSAEECLLISESSVKEKQVSSLADSFYAVTPLRGLSLKGRQTEWEKIQQMESHDEERKKVASLWSANQKLAVDRIRTDWGLNRFSPEEIHKVCGVLEVNAFEVASSGGKCLRAIYPTAYLFAHNCVPNTNHSDHDKYKMQVLAAENIKTGDILTVSYTYTLQSTLKRRKHLQDTKFFCCCCKRCSDPTELNSYAGALRCPLCTHGLVLSSNPLDDSSDWICSSSTCMGYKITANALSSFMNKLENELDSIEGNDISGYENFLQKYKSILHENHYQCLAALHCLSQLYGKISGYIISELTQQQLQRKVDICTQLIKVFEKLEPKFSKQRGILLYELHAPLMILVRRQHEERSLPRKEMKNKLKEICKYLEEGWKILSKENPVTSEGQMADSAKEALDSLKLFINRT